MAPVTLRDLMNPLLRIAAATEKTSDKLDALAMVVAGNGNGSAATLNQEIVKELKAQTALLKTISDNTKGGMSSPVSDNKPEETNLKSGAEALKLLGAGTQELAKGLILFRFVPKKTVETFANTIKELFKIFKEEIPDENKLKTSANAFKIISDSILKFSTSLALASVLLIPGLIGAVLLNKSISIILSSFNSLGENENIEKGANAFKIISDSILKFSVGLALASVLLIPGLVGAILLSATVLLLMPAFILLGNNSEEIKKGADVLNLIGSSLISFAKGLVIAALASVVGIIFTPIIVAAILLIGGAFVLLGKFEKPIKEGADSLKKMSSALLWFSLGLVAFALTSMFILMEPKILLAMVGTLVIIGGTFALLGLFEKPIKKGAIALALVGLSLIVFSVGYLIFTLATKDVTLEDLGIQAAILGGTALIVGIAGAAGFANIILGAIAFAAIGGALWVFSFGYKPFAESTKDITLEDVGIQAALLLGLGLEFAAAGFAALAIIPGAVAFAAIGGALWALSKGLSAFKALGWKEEDSASLYSSLASIKLAFLGTEKGEEDGIGGFFKKIGGVVTGGIDSVRMLEAAAGFAAAGFALKSLSKGLIAFKDVKWDDELSKKLVIMLNGVTTAFALAGKGEQVPSSSFFGQMFGFSRTAVEEGIKSVMGAGKALINIVKGLQGFQELVEKKTDFNKIGESIKTTLTFVQSAFASIADEGNVQGAGFWGSAFNIKRNKVEEGIRSVQGAGEELMNIVKGLQGFQELVEKKADFNKIGAGIKTSLTLVGNAFAAIGGKEMEEGDSALFGLIKWDENKVEKGIDAVKGAGEELIKIAEGLVRFDTIKNPAAIATKITQLFTSVGSIFTYYYDKPDFKSRVDHMQGFISELGTITEKGLLDKAADGFQKMATAINSVDKTKAEKFAELFKGAGNLPKNKSQYDALIKAVKEIKDALKSDTSTTTSTNKSSESSTNKPAQTTTKPATSSTTTSQSQSQMSPNLMNSLNSTLNRLSTAIDNLPNNMKNIKIVVDSNKIPGSPG